MSRQVTLFFSQEKNPVFSSCFDPYLIHYIAYILERCRTFMRSWDLTTFLLGGTCTFLRWHGNPLSLVLSLKISFGYQRRKTYSARAFTWDNVIIWLKPKITWILYEPVNLAFGKPEASYRQRKRVRLCTVWRLYASPFRCLYETFVPSVSRQVDALLWVKNVAILKRICRKKALNVI